MEMAEMARPKAESKAVVLRAVDRDSVAGEYTALASSRSRSERNRTTAAPARHIPSS